MVFLECQGKCNLDHLATGIAVKQILQKDFKLLNLLDSQMAVYIFILISLHIFYFFRQSVCKNLVVLQIVFLDVIKQN